MRTLRLLLLTCIAMVAVTACQRNGQVLTAGLLDTDRAFAGLSSDQGFAAAFDRYAMDNAVLMPEYSAALKGRAVVDKALSSMPAGTRLSWTPQEADVSSSGDLGYTWGVYELNGTNASGQPTLSYGKYLSVWKQQDGTWKLAAMMTSQSPGPTG